MYECIRIAHVGSLSHSTNWGLEHVVDKPLCCGFRLLHPDSPAHEGYPAVPTVFSQLTGLKQVELHVSSGQNARLEAAAGVPDVQLVLTLARYEQSPFSR